MSVLKALKASLNHIVPNKMTRHQLRFLIYPALDKTIRRSTPFGTLSMSKYNLINRYIAVIIVLCVINEWLILSQGIEGSLFLFIFGAMSFLTFLYTVRSARMMGFRNWANRLAIFRDIILLVGGAFVTGMLLTITIVLWRTAFGNGAPLNYTGLLSAIVFVNLAFTLPIYGKSTWQFKKITNQIEEVSSVPKLWDNQEIKGIILKYLSNLGVQYTR